MVTCYPLPAFNWLQNEWPWMTLSGYLTSKSVFGQHAVAAEMRVLEPIAQMWMKIDPYYQRQKCRPMNVVSENIRSMRIFAGFPLSGGVKRHWGLSRTASFGDLGGYVSSSKTSEIQHAILWRYATPCRPANDCKMNDLEWLFHDKMLFRPALLESERLNVRNNG